MKKLVLSLLALSGAFLLPADVITHTYTMEGKNTLRATFTRDAKKVTSVKGFKGKGVRVITPAKEKGFTVHTAPQFTEYPKEITIKGKVKGKGSFHFGFIVYDRKPRIYWITTGTGSFSKAFQVNSDKFQEFSYTYRPMEPDVKKITRFLTSVSVRPGSDIVIDEVTTKIVENPRPVNTGSFKVIPYVKKVPAMRGKFDPAAWRFALKLGNFIPKTKGKSAVATPHFSQASGSKSAVLESKADPTTIYLARDKHTLYAAIVLDGEDVVKLLKQEARDRKRPVFTNNRIEMFFGEKAFFQFIVDWTGRTYCSSNVSVYSFLNHKRKSIVARIAIPLEKIPSLAISSDITNANFYRQGPKGISSWHPNIKSTFLDMTQTAPLFLESPEKIVGKMADKFRSEIAALTKNASLEKKDADSILAQVTAYEKKALAEKKDVKKYLKLIEDFSKLSVNIGKAQEKCLKTKFGTTGSTLVKPYDGKIPSVWIPNKFMGKDFHYAYTVLPGYTLPLMEKAGMMKHPLYLTGMFHIRFFQHTMSNSLGYPEKFKNKKGIKYESTYAGMLEKYPHNLLMFGADRGKIDHKNPGVQNMYNKEFMKRFDALHGKRTAGFSSPETFISGIDNYLDRYAAWNIPRPKNRKEAYNNMKKLHSLCFDKPFKQGTPTPFRNIGLASKYTRKYARWNSAADIFNHVIHSFGDKISGNENGECMGATPPKYAFARGAARQYGGAWENYQVYYGWAFIGEDGKRSGGMQCAPVSGLSTAYVNQQLTPDCRLNSYCYLNGARVGMGLERQKSQILHPYLCGVGIWRSEADLNELVCPYDMDTIDKDDPLIINLRDEVYHPTAMAKINMHFYDHIVKKRDRGVTVTPVALVYDLYNGYSPLYFGRQVWGFFPPTEIEKVMWALNHHVFKRLPHNNAYSTSKFGDIFDVITNDASSKVLESYPVLYLIGDVTLDKPFAARLQNYVKKGGTLVVNGELLKKYSNALPKAFLGCTLTDTIRQSPGTYSRISGKVISENKAYDYRVLRKEKNAEVIAVTTDVTQSPAILLTPYGKGKVIVTAPCNMKQNGDMDNMLAIFDDLMWLLRNKSIGIKVETKMQYSINRSKSSWIVYFQNNDGLPPNAGIFTKPLKCDLSVKTSGTIRIPHSMGKVKKVIDWWSGKELPFRNIKGETVLTHTLVSGDCCALEFVMK